MWASKYIAKILIGTKSDLPSQVSKEEAEVKIIKINNIKII